MYDLLALLQTPDDATNSETMAFDSFRMTITEVLTCQQCGTSKTPPLASLPAFHIDLSTSTEPTTTTSTIQEALHNYFNAADVQCFCETCKTNTTMYQRKTITAAPTNLLLSCKKNWAGDHDTAARHRFQISNSVNLDDFCDGKSGSSVSFQLHAVVEHVNGTHFRTFIPAGDADSTQWIAIDDDRTSLVQWTEIAAANHVSLLFSSKPLRRRTLSPHDASTWWKKAAQDLHTANAAIHSGTMARTTLDTPSSATNHAHDLPPPPQQPTPPTTHPHVEHIVMRFDGGQQGKPVYTGIAGSGAVLYDKTSGCLLSSHSLYFGAGENFTNNTAEYAGCERGITEASHYTPKTLEVIGDSQLVITQMKGEAQITDKSLVSWHDKTMLAVTNLLQQGTTSVTFTWEPRDQNHAPDALANLAMATRTTRSYTNQCQRILRPRGTKLSLSDMAN
jgi:ribonuclease HI